jgi:hypothetical protein
MYGIMHASDPNETLLPSHCMPQLNIGHQSGWLTVVHGITVMVKDQIISNPFALWFTSMLSFPWFCLTCAVAVELHSLEEPKGLWQHFLHLLEIPRCSGNEAAVLDYIHQVGKCFVFFSFGYIKVQYHV